jgi:DNA integrity scanning protein DisA with diadenylate cyclase activity
MARQGNEGRPVGALFTIGRADDVLRYSRPLILDPLSGHSPESRRITDPDLRGTIKALAQLDGAFVITEQGLAAAACRYLDVPGTGVNIQLGLGSRHVAAAAISKLLHILAVVLSQSGVIRVLFDGRVVWTTAPDAR